MSLLEIFPQIITLYPSDRQAFTARATPPPPMWASTNNGIVQSDYSFQIDASVDGDSEGAHQLADGIGSIEWQINDNCRPTSSGSLQWRIYVPGTSGFFQYGVIITSSTITIKNELGVTINSFSHTVASGDIFRIDISSTVRLYINNVLKHSLTSYSGAVGYPIYYEVFLARPMANSIARIPAPKLTGNWTLRPVVTFTAPSHGSITTTTGNQTEYYNGTIPGTYTLTGQISAADDTGNYQKVTATIIIPPLSILGETSITLQPGQKVRFKTNYDAAQNPLVTWSVVSGSGSFSNGEFTAGTAPGTTVVRASASAGNQIADITITVPAVITSTYEASTPGELNTFTTNMTGTITWTATCGTSGTTGSTFAWTAPNQAGLVCKITATNGTLTKTIEVPVLKKFPYDAHSPIGWDRKKTVLISEAEDRSRSSRVKDKGGLPFEAFELQFKNRDVTELNAVHAFWDEHYPGKRWIYEDKYRTKRIVMYFDSDIRQEVLSDCSVDYSFRAKQG